MKAEKEQNKISGDYIPTTFDHRLTRNDLQVDIALSWAFSVYARTQTISSGRLFCVECRRSWVEQCAVSVSQKI